MKIDSVGTALWRLVGGRASRVTVVRFRNAPIAIQQLSEHGGDEDWVIVACPEFDDETAIDRIVEGLTVCDAHCVEVDGYRVYITAHA